MLEVKMSESENSARIIVVGVGGAGNNAVNRMIDENIAGDSAQAHSLRLERRQRRRTRMISRLLSRERTWYS